MKSIIVIPARYGSSRMEGKVLAKETGKYLVEHTWERARSSKKAHRVLIAADDERVMRACGQFGAECVMTRPDHPSGTDRIAEAVKGVDTDIVLNLQADEPEIDPAYIDLTIDLLANNPEADMATLLAPFENAEQIANPNIVKAVTGRDGRALYFSRSILPYDRTHQGIGPVGRYRRHLGIYAYRKAFLETFTQLAPGTLEQIEKLEQLRALENGYVIVTATVEKTWDGVDTPEQYKEFVKRYRNHTV